MYNIPILYITFNRLDTVKKTFEGIRSIKPKDLYLASDGPRENKPHEDEMVAQVRKYITDNIDWECNIHTLFRTENLGCKYGPSGAIKWFFSQVECGVVLEDDILATKSFFHYCDLLLHEYKNRDDIGFICGCTMSDYVSLKDVDYFKTTVIDGWGWASWSDRIRDFNPDYASLQDNKLNKVKTIFLNQLAKNKILNLSLNSANNLIDAWDYQMADYMAVRGCYTIFPKKALVRNIGFSLDSTHTAIPPKWYKDESFDFNIKVENELYLDKKYTRFYEKDFVSIKDIFYILTPDFIKKLVKKIKRYKKGRD